MIWWYIICRRLFQVKWREKGPRGEGNCFLLSCCFLRFFGRAWNWLKLPSSCAKNSTSGLHKRLMVPGQTGGCNTMAVHTFDDSTCSHGEISAQTLLKDIAGSLLARLERVQEKTITYHLLHLSPLVRWGYSRVFLGAILCSTTPVNVSKSSSNRAWGFAFFCWRGGILYQAAGPQMWNSIDIKTCYIFWYPLAPGRVKTMGPVWISCTFFLLMYSQVVFYTRQTLPFSQRFET